MNNILSGWEKLKGTKNFLQGDDEIYKIEQLQNELDFNNLIFEGKKKVLTDCKDMMILKNI